MVPVLVFLWILAGFVCMAFWEAYIEGEGPWAAKQVGWEKEISPRFKITAYHFWLYMMIFFFLTLPLASSRIDFSDTELLNRNTRLAGVIISGTTIGLMLEDFLWFVINPKWDIRNWNSEYVYWYPWIGKGRWQVPVGYILLTLIAVISWLFLWGPTAVELF